MKTAVNISLRLICLALVCAGATGAARAQRSDAKLQLNDLDRLAAKANETVEVNLNEQLLRLIPVKAWNPKDPKEQNVKEIVAGLKGVYVKSFGFNDEGEYAQADVEAIRRQLGAPGWTRFVNVRNKKKGQVVEVYMLIEGARVGGLSVLAFEPKQLTVVNIVGTIDIEKLSQLEGQFGIPDLDIGPNEKHEPPQKP